MKSHAFRNEAWLFTAPNQKKEVSIFNIKDLPPIEHSPDGSLPRMTPRQRQRANILILNVCCNYDDGNCLLLDDGDACVCVQSISYSVCCKFFRRIVLQSKESAVLKAELLQKDALHRCLVCNSPFASTSNNAKYCAKCAPAIQRKQKAAYARKQRMSRVEK